MVSRNNLSSLPVSYRLNCKRVNFDRLLNPPSIFSTTAKTYHPLESLNRTTIDFEGENHSDIL